MSVDLLRGIIYGIRGCLQHLTNRNLLSDFRYTDSPPDYTSAEFI